MKYVFLNDRSTELGIHPASAVETKLPLAPAAKIIVEIPDDAIPFIKVWDHQVLLGYAAGENADQILKQDDSSV